MIFVCMYKFCLKKMPILAFFNAEQFFISTKHYSDRTSENVSTSHPFYAKTLLYSQWDDVAKISIIPYKI